MSRTLNKTVILGFSVLVSTGVGWGVRNNEALAYRTEMARCILTEWTYLDDQPDEASRSFSVTREKRVSWWPGAEVLEENLSRGEWEEELDRGSWRYTKCAELLGCGIGGSSTSTEHKFLLVVEGDSREMSRAEIGERLGLDPFPKP